MFSWTRRQFQKKGAMHRFLMKRDLSRSLSGSMNSQKDPQGGKLFVGFCGGVSIQGGIKNDPAANGESVSARVAAGKVAFEVLHCTSDREIQAGGPVQGSQTDPPISEPVAMVQRPAASEPPEPPEYPPTA